MVGRTAGRHTRFWKMGINGGVVTLHRSCKDGDEAAAATAAAAFLR
jgi:hypothetical protein